MNTLAELIKEKEAKEKALSEIFTEAGPDLDFSKVKSLEGDTQAKIESVRAKNVELDALYKKIAPLKELSDMRRKLDENAGFKYGIDIRSQIKEEKAEVKTLGELFTSSKLFDGEQFIKNRDLTIPDVNLKTTMTASAGWDPEALRIRRVETYPLRRLSVMDLYPQYTTSYDTIRYMKESTFTQNAIEVAEAAAYNDSAIALTETSDEVELVIAWLPVTDQQLEDVPGLQQYINNRLGYMLQARIDSQLLEGSGTTPYLWGAAKLSSVQTQAKSTDIIFDAIFKAMTKVRGTSAGTGFAEPSAVVLHPNDWQDIRLTRTSDGIYIMGNPADPGPQSLFGVPVLVTSAKTENTGLVGDFTGYAAIHMKRGVTFAISDSHASYFIYNIQAIKCTIRLAAVYYRDSAFCTVTSI